MSGENPMDDRTGDPGEFLSHPRWQRFIVALAGPAMNIMLAIALLTGVYMVHYEYAAVLDEPALVGWVNPDTPAEKAGIQRGDKIVSVEDIQNPNWEQVDIKAALSPNQPLKFGIEHDGKVTEKVLVPEPHGPNQYGSIGWVPKESSVTLTTVEPGMPADKAGIKVGDEILTANGQEIPALAALVQMLNRSKGEALDLVVLRLSKTDLPRAARASPSRDWGGASLPHRRLQPSNESHQAQFLRRVQPLSVGQQEELVPDPRTAAKNGEAQSIDAPSRRSNRNR
jgi:regulator of sigma E protease